jgi:hypothetical protein
MKKHHMAIIVNFVPARMTGLFQPCDVGFQRIFKLLLKKSAHKDVIEEVLAKLEAGTAAEGIIIDAHIKLLCNCTVCWLWVAYNNLNTPLLVKQVSDQDCLHVHALTNFQAWEMCKGGEFNLSYQSLVSSEAMQILHELPNMDPEFYAELTQPRSGMSVLILTEDEALDEDVIPVVNDINNGDDSVIPMEAVVDHVHGELPSGDSNCDFIVGEDGRLQTIAEAEDTTVEEVDGVFVDTTVAVTAVMDLEGRGWRKRTENKLYSVEVLKWWSDTKK